ncbi:LysR family transcriptional regulator [Azohydromonas sp. G-1-1-14]|uniref:LysR family transcriptional regulator n=2 Tax=Azohydromonas caseinilytica TaxID=2728836 RepID=A0A848F9P8_9BURK|nr:LysR family transcriptional regulator [Azohydromonas caseinilytica]
MPAADAPAGENFDWRLVRSFLAVLDAGSLMGAARRLRAQQPTLSRHVAELEAQLGVPLFERTGRGVTPTAAALAIAEAARRMEAGAGELMRALVAARDAERGTVRLTASRVAATWLLPPVLARLQEAEPGIEVELVASDQVSNLLRREADIALRMVRPEQGSLVARRIAEVPLTAAAHERYLARAGTPMRAEELAAHRLIGYDRDDTIVQGFAAMGVPMTRGHFQLRTDDQVAYGQLVAAGAGIGFVARYQLRQWPGVVALLPQLGIPPMPCWLAVHREVHGNRLVRRVFDFLAEEVPRALAAGEG